MIKVAVLYGHGFNCDRETKFAIEKAAQTVDIEVKAERVHTNEFLRKKKDLMSFQMLVFPGGFLHGDALGAGTILAKKLRNELSDEIKEFIRGKRLILGICNGFQVLVKYPLLPSPSRQNVTLTFNDSGRFEDRWVWLKVNDGVSPFLKGIDQLYLPIRHAEGKFVASKSTLNEIKGNDQVALKYAKQSGEVTHGTFPYNPNGSLRDIAGICDKTGKILGLMPHPEAFIHYTNRPNWELTKREAEEFPEKGKGLQIFENALRFLVS